MPAAKVFLFILVIYLIGFFGHAFYLRKTVYGDGIFYYSWLQSMIINHAINFPHGNIYSIGPALLWAPGFILVHSVIHGDGQSLPYQMTVGLESVLFALIGLLLLYRTLEQFFNTVICLLTVVAIAFTTNLWFYGSLDTVNSHALSFFASVFFLALLFRKNKNFFLLGMSVGLLALIRVQDAAFGILLAPYLNRKSIITLSSGFLIAFLPQLLAWQLVYHKFWMSPYVGLPGYGFNVFRPQIGNVLFSIHNGLILWTPIVGIAFVGLFFKNKIKKHHEVLFILLILIEIFIVASWSTWWQGASYSGRMFVSLLPVFAFGIASIFDRLQKYHWTISYYLVSIIGPLAVINMLLIIFFLLHKSSI